MRKCILILFASYFFLLGYAFADTGNKFKFPFYFGITSGYGNTTWSGLVPPGNKQNLAMAMSTPKYVSEGGIIWGFFAGLELLPYFALETSYTKYPNAKVAFDPASIFTFEHDGLTSFVTKTETVSVLGKIMMIIPCSTIRAFSGLGVAEVHRRDQISNHWKISPSFNAGFNYNIDPHIMTELGLVYTAGKGQSELNPIEDYFPFLYAIYLHLAYRF